MMPLSGKRIVITRAALQAEAFAEQLQALGAEPILLPMISIAPPEESDRQSLDRALQSLGNYDWVFLTSANAVEHIWARYQALGMQKNFPPLAVVGSATARALNKYGLQAAFIANEHTSEALFAEFASAVDLNGLSGLLPQGNLANPTLAENLWRAGAGVDVVTAYHTIRPDTADFSIGPFDAITFVSPSSVIHFCELIERPTEFIGGALVGCIGPVTAQTADELGLQVDIVADPHTVEGLIAGLIQAYQERTIAL